MRYLVVMVSVLLFVLPGAVFSESGDQSLTEAGVLERMAGTWAEDREATLEQINRRLEEEELSSETRGQLHFVKSVVSSAELQLHFSEDGAARITGHANEEQLEERGQVKVLSVNEGQADIALEGGENFLNRELTVVFEDNGFYFIINGIKRHYERQ